MRVLIIDNEPSWREELTKVAQAATFDGVECTTAACLETARQHIERNEYALIFVDLKIPMRESDREESDENGMTLLRELRSSKRNRNAACIVMTGFGTAPRVREALKDLRIQEFLDKIGFQRTSVAELTRKALFSVARARVEQMYKNKFELTLVLTDAHLVFALLSGPGRFRDMIPNQPLALKTEETHRRADRIERFVHGKMSPELANVWREEALEAGAALFGDLFDRTLFGNVLDAARDLPDEARDLRLYFSGTRRSLDMPFELLHDRTEYLTLSYPLVRQITSSGVAARKAIAFRNSLVEMEEQGETLNVLLLASNVGGRIDKVDDEVMQLKTLLDERLAESGIRREVVAVPTSDASYSHVESLLRSRKWHIIHYAGHGRWNPDLPEHSSLVFQDITGPRHMPASVLIDYVKDSATLLFCLNGCLGARTAGHPERGDLYGLMDSLVQAGVPIVLGHRWSVSDGAARALALTFYGNLFTSWSVEDALFEARQAVIHDSPYHRDDPGWASPILVAQTSYHRG